jgi:hypothetical protein
MFAVGCLAASLYAVAACAGSGGQGEIPGLEEESAMADTTIVAAQQALTDSVMSLPGVVGTAIGLCGDTPCIKVYLAREDAELRSQIPETFRGFTVDVEVTGEFHPREP